MSYSCYLPPSEKLTATKRNDDGSKHNLHTSPLIGLWINTNKDTQGISHFEIKQNNDSPTNLTLTVYSVLEKRLQNWGELALSALFEDDMKKGGYDAFITEYNFDYVSVRLQANMNLGLIILTALNVFKDNSGRINYFSREYYRHKAEG